MDLIRKAVDAKISSLGLDWVKLESFQIRSKDKTISADVLLEGETEIIHVEATYAVIGSQISVLTVSSSRKWVAEAARLALAKAGGSFDLPAGITGMLVRLFL
jgi:hypothetical protein